MALVFGDIHGNANALNTLLAKINTKDQQLIFLGDYVDRGADSKQVIDTLIKLKHENKAICLLGNHEEMMLNCLDASSEEAYHYFSYWIRYGGVETLESYGIDTLERKYFHLIPESHIDFLNQLIPFYETSTHLFTHACPDPKIEIDQQLPETLRWWKTTSNDLYLNEKPMIFGHISQQNGKPKRFGENLCIDTSWGGWITCFDTETNLIHQADSHERYLSYPLDHLKNLENK